VFPIRTMPEALQAITRIVPARYFLVILRGVVLKGADLTPYWDQMGWLALYAVVVTGLASIRFARQRG
jgi:ABC-2 type transport system permease protein